MTFRYSPFVRNLKKFSRKIFPIPKSPYTIGELDDICEVNLVPPDDLKIFFNKAIKRLSLLKGEAIGDYLEFGVFNGSSITSMYQVVQEMELKDIRLFGFDAFEGLPEGSEEEDDGVWKKGFYSCSFEQMKTCLQRKQIDPKEITWVQGWYKDTLSNETTKKYSIRNVGIIFIDCDTYSSSKLVLDFISPLLTKPAIICFDDWKLFDLDIKGMGEYRAFNEFLENNQDFIAKEIKSYNRKSKSFIITKKQ